MEVKPDLDASPPPRRRPRGFAAAAASASTGTLDFSGGGKGRKEKEIEKESEKERTKLRERHRRAITSRILAGLRQYGNFPLPARADMNDVLAAVAREAGWTVEADGTTFRSFSPALVPGTPTARTASFPDRRTDSSSPASFDSVVVMDEDIKDDRYVNSSHMDSTHCVEADDLLRDMHNGCQEADFSGTPYVPVYVMLPTGVVNGFCQLVDPVSVRKELWHLKLLHVDGVVVNCWWGIVEGWTPQKYMWSGYRDLFNIIREFKMKLQVVMAFNECLANGSGDFSITLPKWILEIGKDNQDIFFTDREGRRNTECLSWGVDKERVLKGRTAIEAYFDFMRSFRMEFNDFFAEGLISAVEIGLGASGELKYPSFSERMGWRYPGIGEFQCYDKYMQQSLRRAAKIRGHLFWARGPDNAGHYNAQPHETGFFSDRGDYDSYYGRFFLCWYSKTLIDHADNVLRLARLTFEETEIAVKIPAVYWWYRTRSHAAELTAGFYNPANRDGYSAIFEVLRKHLATVKFVLSGPHIIQENGALADSSGVNWQLLNSAWDKGLSLAAQNALPCHDKEGYLRILETTKPRNDPDRRHLSFFSYHSPSLALEQRLSGLDYFVRCMHGELLSDAHA